MLVTTGMLQSEKPFVIQAHVVKSFSVTHELKYAMYAS